MVTLKDVLKDAEDQIHYLRSKMTPRMQRATVHTTENCLAAIRKARRSHRPKVIVEVSGGVAYVDNPPPEVNVQIIDHDEIGSTF